MIIDWPMLGLTFIYETVLLAFGLWIMASDDSPFDEYGVRNTLARCLALTGALFGLSFVSLFVLSSTGMSITTLLILLGIRLGFWFIGSMVLFGLTVGRAFLLALVCWTISFGIEKLL